MKKSAASSKDVSVLEMKSSWGVIQVVAENGLVKSCALPSLRSEPGKPFKWLNSRRKAVSPADAAALRKAENFVRSLMKGTPCRPPGFNWPAGTPFMTRVWRALTGIPAGNTIEYSELARKIGRPGGSRAVGRACGSNPIPLFIPCHRVLPKDGTLGGFSSGLPWKRLLLEREKAAGSRK